MNRLAVLVVAGLLLQPRDRLLQSLHIGEDQLGLDHLDIGAGVHLAVDVDDIVVGEHSHHLTDRVALADIGQELITQPGALRCAFDDAGDIDEGHRRRQDALRAEDLGQPVQPWIGHRDDALVGLDGGERIVGRQHVIAGQRVE